LLSYLKSLQKFKRFTYCGVKKQIPSLKSQRFHDVIKVFAAIGFLKKMGQVYLWMVNMDNIAEIFYSFEEKLS
jgi:virulence-associated protein VapD